MVLCVTLLFVQFFTVSQAQAGKFALVVGNDSYDNVADLQKAVNDSQVIGETLESQGFTVIRGTNLTRRNMNQTIARFTGQLQQGDEAVFFYAGHGVEIAGQNFLLPTDIPAAGAGSEDFVKSESVAVSRVLDSIRSRGPRVSILILDACRDNPFPKNGTRSLGGTRGFVGMNAPKGTFIMYSAGVGQTALDRLSDNDPHPNSVFTRSLVPLLKTPGLPITKLTRQLRRDVEALAQKVSHDQRPAYYDEITGDFFFRAKLETTAPPNTDTTANPPTPPKPVITQNDNARLAWDIIKDSNRIGDFEAFVDTFGSSFFAKLAANRIKELKDKVAIVKPVQPKPKPKPRTVVTPKLPSGPEVVILPSKFWPIGKWPEGLVSDENSLWVAESGLRQIAQVSKTDGHIIKRIKVGRLPVDMEIVPDGTIYSLVYTSRLVWSQPKRGKGRSFARLRHYPEAMESDERAIWVLVLPNGSSESAKVVRLNRRNGDAIGSHILPQNASELVLHDNVLWVVHGLGPGGGMVSKLDPDTLADLGSVRTLDSISKIDANSYGVFAAGGIWNQSGVVVKFDPHTGDQVGRVTLPSQFIYSMAVSHDYVIVAGYQGRIWIIDAQDMTVRRQIDLENGPFQPSHILAEDNRLYITTHGGGDQGAVVVVDNWRP